MDKGYLLEIRELERKIDTEKAYLIYEDTFGIVRDFLGQVALDSSNLDEWQIGDEARSAARSYLEISYGYSRGNVSALKLKDSKIQAWGDIDRFPESDGKLIRLVLSSLWDKQGYLDSVDSDMQDNYFSTVLVLAYRLDSKLGRAFREFVERDQRLKDCRII